MSLFKSQKRIEKEFGDKVDTEIRAALRRWADMLANGKALVVEQEMRHLLATPRRS